MTDLARLRRDLHRGAELSGREASTAARVRRELEACAPSELVPGLGGHGVAACWRSERPGANVLLRCELDALPIADPPGLPHASTSAGVAHKCGHDGHMALLVAVARRLAADPPAAGAVTLLFQPAEETGEGAERVLADPSFARLAPDVALALHNLPGFPLGAVLLRSGTFAFGSVGAEIAFNGAESHAAEPEHGRSPAVAIARTVLDLHERTSALDPGDGAFTVTHVRLGEPAFGTSPGAGRVFATLRAPTAEGLAAMRRDVESVAVAIGRETDVDTRVAWREPFPVTECDGTVVAAVEAQARALALPVFRLPAPLRWSEDFGHFTARFPGALFGLGAGEAHPALHHPDYDFPDGLLVPGADLLERTARALGARPVAGAGAGGPA